MNVLRDIGNGWLSLWELPRFLWWLVWRSWRSDVGG